MEIDPIDKRILAALQHDAGQSLDALGERVGLSRNACWRRVRRLEEEGVILKRIALVDPARLGRQLVVFIGIKTREHDAAWSKKFSSIVRAMPEILGVYRTSGQTDYLLKARVADVAAYDALYQRLTEKVKLTDVSASFVMEEIKETTEIPVL